jgi:hypothetical protein
MICLICGEVIGKEIPVPIAELRFTPIVPYLPGVTQNKLGSTVLTDRFCCQSCYKKIKMNDQEIIEEAGSMPDAARSQFH